LAKLFPPLEPEFDLEEAKNVLGIPKTAPIDETTAIVLGELRETALKLIEPKGIYELVEVEVKENGVAILTASKSYEIASRRLAGRLKGSSSAYIFAVTIGKNLEEKVNDYFQKGDYHRALVLDAVGSAFAEGLAESAQKFLSSLDTKYELTPRFSPGYGDLELKVQEIFFEILDPQKIGIQLTKSYMMLPRKSVTAISGRILTEKTK
jgi:cobalamin-dependent methionine synthase I